MICVRVPLSNSSNDTDVVLERKETLFCSSGSEKNPGVCSYFAGCPRPTLQELVRFPWMFWKGGGGVRGENRIISAYRQRRCLSGSVFDVKLALTKPPFLSQDHKNTFYKRRKEILQGFC